VRLSWLTQLVRDTRAERFDHDGTRRRSTVVGFRARSDARAGTFGIFSCSKATNEVNFAAQKFSRQVLGSNNIDSCNRT
jgi:formate dehydrogenase major subunit